MTARARDRGQATPEWIGLVLLVALAMTALAAGGFRIPGLDLGVVLASRIACAAGIGADCGEESELELAYGSELASLVSASAPTLEYEAGMRALPVDFRSCREDACAEGAEAGPVAQALGGEPVTAFVHTVDCRDPTAADPAFDCSGERAGNLYLQYWLYYPGSATARALLGERGFHPDDFESFQLRLRPGGEVDARASSHRGYNDTSGSWLSDAGVVERAGWTPATGRYAISGGSHAGRVGDGDAALRWTEPGSIRLIPIELLGDAAWLREFAVTPPWEKRVYLDPEYHGTD